MTREEILKMEVGEELDAIVSALVMGKSLNYAERYWTPSGSMEDAWDVVMKMNESGCHVTLNMSGSRCSCGFWGERFASVAAETMPLAICRASLLVVEEQLPKHSE